MLRNRSHGSVIQSAIDLKSWIGRTPTVAEARPAACLGCKAASCPVGGRIQLHGHGVRERQVRGPPGPGEDAAVVVITGRRYRCVPCGAVLLRVSPATALGFHAMAGWVTLRRWAKAVKQKHLFSSVPAAGPSATLREVAAAAATALAARSDPTTRHLPLEQRAFLGAAHAA